jgi:hypothetical protein
MAAVRRTVRKKKSTAKKQSLLARIDFKGVILSVLILSFLLFSLGALVYVVFFHTVIVMERGDGPPQFLVQLASNAPLFFWRC